MSHQSVLLKESIEGLAIKPDGIYVDATFGRGGHTAAILQALGEGGRLIGIDKDETAVTHGHQTFGKDPRFQMYHGSFSRLSEFAKRAGVYGRVDGLLLDLGVSSPQLDDPMRGFSFMQDGPLDMRMDKSQGLDARAFINQASAADLSRIFRDYGEERFAGRIANAIVQARTAGPIKSTSVLAQLVKEANPKWEKHKHPATRVFQAIRIHVNNELADLSAVLDQGLDILALGGRIVVISFHSLEDRIVKRFMRDKEQGQHIPPGIPLRVTEQTKCFRRIGKALKPLEAEIKENIRARSAVLRIGEKLA